MDFTTSDNEGQRRHEEDQRLVRLPLGQTQAQTLGRSQVYRGIGHDAAILHDAEIPLASKLSALAGEDIFGKPVDGER
jgi:hypothetical protein